MGTSNSSSGPGPGAPFDPPWLDELADGVLPAVPPGSEAQQTTSTELATEDAPSEPTGQDTTGPVAPERRFAGARLALGRFAREGGRDNLKRALGRYSRQGMGGASRVAQRMRMSGKAAGALVHLLQSARDGTDPQITQWVQELSARNPSSDDVASAIIQKLISSGGSLDEDTCRDSMARAFSDLLEGNPDLDLVRMGDETIWSLLERFLGYEALNRVEQDIGQLFERNNLSPATAVQRINEMRDYLMEVVSAEMRKLKTIAGNIESATVQQLVAKCVTQTFVVFEGAE